MNPGHTFTLPDGHEIAEVLQQLWLEQLQALLLAVGHHGRRGILYVDLERWRKPLIDRLLPLYQQYALQGQAAFRSHAQPKHYKHSTAIQLFSKPPPAPTAPPQQQVVAQYDDYVEVFDPNVEEFARKWVYEFAESTLATSKKRVLEVYQRTAEIMANNRATGETVNQLTQDLTSIFNDPLKANRIALTESSRSFHGGQLISAEESGEVSGKTWLASADACQECLKLNGKTVPLDEPFVILPGAGKYGTVMFPPLHPHCMCSLTYDLSPQPAIPAANRQEGRPGLSFIPGLWNTWFPGQAA